jgi:hypothetical protein
LSNAPRRTPLLLVAAEWRDRGHPVEGLVDVSVIAAYFFFSKHFCCLLPVASFIARWFHQSIKL